jgi:cytochrome c553
MNAMLSVALAIFFQLVFCAGVAAQAKGDANAGKVKYQTLCAACHGNSGRGDGPAAGALNPKPADLSEAAFYQTVNDTYLVEIIKEGGSKVKKSPLMPAWRGALSDTDIMNVIAYLRSLPTRKSTP